MLFSVCWSRKTEGQAFSGVSALGIKKALSLGMECFRVTQHSSLSPSGKFGSVSGPPLVTL